MYKKVTKKNKISTKERSALSKNDKKLIDNYENQDNVELTEKDVKKYPRLKGLLNTIDPMRVASEILDWADKPTSTNFNEFLSYEIITLDKVFEFKKKYKWFEKAYKYMNAKIATRRESYLNEEKLHARAYAITARAYDKINFKQWEDERVIEAKLKSEVIEKAESKQVVKELLEELNQDWRNKSNKEYRDCWKNGEIRRENYNKK